ncbi:MAG: hypothetical protein V2A74_07810, partial [bacterium]
MHRQLHLSPPGTNNRSSAQPIPWARAIGRFAAMLVVSATLWQGCSRNSDSFYYQPEENLLNVVTELYRHFDDDLYRFPYPLDLSGQNLFKATLVRLANYEKLHPDRFREEVLYAKGLCYERLGDYPAAMKNYSEAEAAQNGLTLVAAARRQKVARLSAIVDANRDRTSLDRYLAELKFQIDDLDALTKDWNDDQDFGPLARLEREALQRERALVLFRNRYVIPDGSRAGLDAAEELIESNPDSRSHYSHLLMLGDFYSELAHDYVILYDPARAEFESDEFDRLVSAAQRLYFEVSEADGYPEKLEA